MTDWTLVGAVLGAGLLLGGFLLLVLGRRGAPATGGESSATLRDLRAERDLLIERLRGLEFDPRDPETIAAERRELELRAARVLRDLDRASRSAPAAEAPASPRPSTLRGFAWGLGSAAFVVLLLALLMQFSQDRPAGAPPTGAPLGAAEAVEAGIDPELLALIQRAEQEPENADAKLDLIQGLLARERYVDAWPFIQQLATTLPDSPRRLLYEATVREAMGQWEQARALLDRALEGDATLAEAWVRRGLVSFELGDWGTALASWEKALELRPDGRSVLEPVIAEARRRLEAGEPPPVREPPAGAPMAAAGAPSTEAKDEEGAVRIRVELSDAVRERAGEGGFLFVTARPAGASGGPPVAAKRVPATSFPLELSLGPADTMMGQPFPDSARIEVRLDRDGNAMTQDPGDPRAVADPVVPGAALRLVLE